MNAFNSLGDLALLLGLSMTRLAVAFALLPLFTQDSVPAMVRNSLFASLAIITLVLQPMTSLGHLGVGGWITLFGKEALLGIGIGVLGSSLLWALEAAGNLIDVKSGAGMAQVMDPMSGHQTSFTGLFLGRLAGYVFVASGGLMLLTGTLLESYAIWPVDAPLPPLRREAVGIFESEFGRLMLTMMMIAAPVIVLLFVVDAALGVVNRYAPNLNLLTTAPPIKSLLALLAVTVMLGSTIDLLVRDFTTRPLEILRILQGLFVR